MSFNYGYERKKFDAEQAKLREEYIAAGMSEEAIEEMYLFDLEEFRRRRRIANNESPMLDSDFEEGCEDESLSVYLVRNMEAMSVTDIYHDSNRFGWLQEIEDIALYERLIQLSDESLEILTKYVFDGMTQSEIAKEKGIAQKNISKKIKKIKKFLSKGV